MNQNPVILTYVNNTSGEITTWGSIYTADGTTRAKFESITEKFSSKYARHEMPGADKDLLQKLGTSNREFTIKGIILTYQYGFHLGGAYGEDAGFLRDMVDTTGSISFVNSFGTSDILTGGATFTVKTSVLWTGVSFEDRGGRPMERRFTITAVEIR